MVQTPLLPASEQSRLHSERNCTTTAYPRDKCVHWLFEEQVEQSPESVAIICGDQQLTYRELNRRANQLAHYLRAMGVGPETPVAICVDRSPEMVVGLLAILKAGGAYVPLDPDSPPQRQMLMLADAEAPIVITTEQRASDFVAYDGQVVILDANDSIIASFPTENPARCNTAMGLAYVMYTSGSTGQPKGVSIVHRGVVRLVKDTNYASFDPCDVFLQLAPLAFDASTIEIWGPLLNGARLAIAPPGILTLAEIGACIRRYQVTTLWLTAGLFHQMVEHQLDDLQGVKQLLAGGDVLSPAHVRKAVEQLPRCQIINGYGPTENTTFTCCYAVDRSLEKGSRVPIGRPISNTEVYVLDEERRPVSPGAPGELFVGGDGLAREYWRSPELTREKFVAIELAPNVVRRLYRTGDRVRWRSDGNLEFLGRFDQQVKLRGYRIEPGEIECSLQQHLSVDQAVVQPREHRAGGKHLAAFVVLQRGRSATGSELREFLMSRLPSYMIPAEYHFLEKLPLTANGKIDRRQLLTLTAPSLIPQASTPPTTDMERQLCQAWEELLQERPVCVDRSFVECGGDSLRALQLIAHIRETYGVELSISELLCSGTVAQHARQIECALQSQAAVSQSGPSVVSREQPLPLSSHQERLWFVEQLAAESCAYNIALAYRFVGRLDIDLLQRCLQQIVNRHEVFQTTIVCREGVPEVRLRVADGFSLERLDLRSIPEAERELRLVERFTETARRPFDLERGPLFRMLLAEISDEEHAFLFSVHHIIFDGWSEGVFFRELAALYAASRSDAPWQLAPLPFQYADFAVWQRQQVQEQSRERKYWRNQLSGAPPVLELPRDFPRSALQSFAGRTLFRELSASLTDDLQRLSRKQASTLFPNLLAAFQILVHRYTGQTDLVVGAAVQNRERSDLEGLIGFFANTVALRTDLSGNPTFAELTLRAQQVTLDALEHQRLPFQDVVQELGVERNPAYPPVAQVVFVLHDASLSLPGLKVTRLPIDCGGAKFDLTFTVVNQPGGLELWLEYNTALFAQTTIERLLAEYEDILQEIVKNPQQRLIGRMGLPTPGATAATPPAPSAAALTRDRPDVSVECRVTAIWRRLLQVESIDSADDFFQLGGNSLLAVELAACLAAEFDQKLSIGQLFQNRTIESQSSLLRCEVRHGASSALIHIRSGTERPLVMFPNLGGEALLCDHLFRALPTELPLVAIELKSPLEVQNSISIEDLAEQCRNALQSSPIQPPYRLLGYSFGGILAYETACQFERLGIPVEFVGLIDSGPAKSTDASIRRRLNVTWSFVANVPVWFADQIRNRKLLATLAHRGKRLLSLFQRDGAGDDTQFELPLPEDELPDFLRGQTNADRSLKRLHFRAYSQYVPGVYRGRVALFRARVRPLLHHFTRDAGWSRSAVANLENYPIPASHVSILADPQAQILADRIQVALNRALQPHPAVGRNPGEVHLSAESTIAIASPQTTSHFP